MHGEHFPIGDKPPTPKPLPTFSNANLPTPTPTMCNISSTQVAMKKRARAGANMETVTKRAKQIALDDALPLPTSPVDVAADFEDAGATSESSVDFEESFASREQLLSSDLNLEVKLMQGAVHDMQATVNLAAERISELRALLMQYAESR